MDWGMHFPKLTEGFIEFADIGCGYGGLLSKWTLNYSLFMFDDSFFGPIIS